MEPAGPGDPGRTARVAGPAPRRGRRPSRDRTARPCPGAVWRAWARQSGGCSPKRPGREPVAGARTLLGRTRAFLRLYYALIAAILVGVAATITAFFYYQHAERVRLRSDFETMAKDRAQSLREELAKHETVLQLLGAFYEASSETIPDELDPFRRRVPGVLAGSAGAGAAPAGGGHHPAAARLRAPGSSSRPPGRCPVSGLQEVGETGEIRPAAAQERIFPRAGHGAAAAQRGPPRAGPGHRARPARGPGARQGDPAS